MKQCLFRIKTDCIFEVDYAGNILKEVGGTGSGEGEFISPSAITMCNEKFMCWIKEIIEYKYWIKNLIILKK